MEKRHPLEREFTQQGIALAIVGLDEHVSLSVHPAAGRLRGTTTSQSPSASWWLSDSVGGLRICRRFSAQLG